jgi:hypothetical protein
MAGGLRMFAGPLPSGDGRFSRPPHAPDDDAWQTVFVPGDTAVVFQRESDETRIVTVDVSKLMTARHR